MNNNFKLTIGLFAFFLGALGLYICSVGQTALGVLIMIATLVGTFLTVQDKKYKAAMNRGKNAKKGKKKKKNRRR